MSECLGIDISHWNQIINYNKICDQVDFIILKAGGSEGRSPYLYYKDECFDHNYKEFHDKRGINVGCYYFVGRGFISVERGVRDAEHFLSIIKGKKFEYPVIIDLEATIPKDKAGATDAVKAFCNKLEKEGYYAMIYASDISGFKDRLNASMLTDYDKWVARYGSQPTYIKDWGIWQKSSKGMITGIQGYVDLDVCRKSYPAIIRRAGLNGY